MMQILPERIPMCYLFFTGLDGYLARVMHQTSAFGAWVSVK